MVWDVSPIMFELGPLKIRYYGLIFAAMLIGGFYIIRWQMMRGGHSERQAEKLVIWGVIAVIVGSRLGHVLFYEPGRYFSDPIEILKIWKGGLASHGATLGLLIMAVLYSRSEKIPLVEIIDRVTMPAALGAMSVRIGNFFNSEIVGRVTDVPWAVKFPRSSYDRMLPLAEVPARHPSQLYEFLMGLAVLIILYLVDRKYKEQRPLGLLASLFFIFYFSGRFFVEFFKAYQTLGAESSPLTMGQYLSIPLFFGGVVGLYFTFKKNIPTSSLAPQPPQKGGPSKSGKKKKGSKNKGKKKK